MSTAIVWFRKELRIHDNEALSKALKIHKQIIPFYCFEETEFVSDIPYGIWIDIKFFTNVYSPFDLFTDNI